ncbi:MAG TPA: hypothetical protein VMT46_10360 [Anaerolineaceae bacterium]|nr:hypothetical protein [Anaerolineaceae bacterium]
MAFNLGGNTYHPISVDFITSSYRIVGKVLVTYSGMMGIMTDTNSSVVEVHDAQLARLDMPNRLADRFEIARLVKKQIVAICLSRREDMGSVGFNSYSPSPTYPLRLVTASYEIIGNLEWAGRFDVSAIMAKGTRDFITLYNARIAATLVPTMHVESPVMLVNRNLVDLFALSVQENMDEEV